MDDDTACPEIRSPNHPKGFGGPAKSISGSTNVSGPKDLHHSDLAGLAKTIWLVNIPYKMLFAFTIRISIDFGTCKDQF